MPSFFFFNDTATTEIYTLSLHDALPISYGCSGLVPLINFSASSDTPRVLPLPNRSEEHTSELQSQSNLVCRLLLEKKKQRRTTITSNIIHHVRHHDTIAPVGRTNVSITT